MKRVGILIVFLIIVGGSLWFFKDDILGFYSKFNLKLPEVKKEIGIITQEIENQILTPPPLISEDEAQQSSLTKEGVIRWTNSQREKNGLPSLKENVRLDASTAIKAEDMFQNQYFTHESPIGVGVGDLVKEVDYEFIIIGENLALGNFKDDETLVQAWMDSPGHRENILNIKYTEIGVAVIQGKYEGRTVWMAVQHFGFPLSSCQEPDSNLKLEISTDKNQIQELETELDNLKIQIQNMRPRQRENYSKKVDQYNDLVLQYNNLVKELENLIGEYNLQVSIFNNCAGGN